MKTPDAGHPRWVGTALRSGAVALGAIVLAGQLAAFTVVAAGGPGSVATAPAIGWLYTSVFLHVPLELRAASASGNGSIVSSGVSAALMTGTLGAVAVCAWAGARAARGLEERPGMAAAAGAVAGAIVAGGVLLGSIAARVYVDLPGNPLVGDVTVRPDPAGALLWVVAVALVPAVAGALWACRRTFERRDGPARVVAAAAGGVRMLMWALALGVVASLALSASRPDAAAAYLRKVSGPGLSAAAGALGHHALALPNQSVFLLVPAMGGCDTIETGPLRIDAVCLRRLPRAVTLDLATPATGVPPAIGRAPWEFLLLPLIPLIAGVAGGTRVGRRRAHDRPAARALAGAAAGLVFAGLVAVAAETAAVTVSGPLLAGDDPVRYGPPVAVAAGLAAAWGMAGGTVGALMGPVSLRSRPPRYSAPTP